MTAGYEKEEPGGERKSCRAWYAGQGWHWSGPVLRDLTESKGRGRKPARKSFQESEEEAGGLKQVTAMEMLRGGCEVSRHTLHTHLLQ